MEGMIFWYSIFFAVTLISIITNNFSIRLKKKAELAEQAEYELRAEKKKKNLELIQKDRLDWIELMGSEKLKKIVRLNLLKYNLMMYYQERLRDGMPGWYISGVLPCKDDYECLAVTDLTDEAINTMESLVGTDMKLMKSNIFPADSFVIVKQYKISGKEFQIWKPLDSEVEMVREKMSRLEAPCPKERIYIANGKENA